MEFYRIFSTMASPRHMLCVETSGREILSWHKSKMSRVHFHFHNHVPTQLHPKTEFFEKYERDGRIWACCIVYDVKDDCEGQMRS